MLKISLCLLNRCQRNEWLPGHSCLRYEWLPQEWMTPLVMYKCACLFVLYVYSIDSKWQLDLWYKSSDLHSHVIWAKYGELQPAIVYRRIPWNYINGQNREGKLQKKMQTELQVWMAASVNTIITALVSALTPTIKWHMHACNSWYHFKCVSIKVLPIAV